ncbi:levansucrase [Celeribacter arenosi]|uniref:Glycosyl hydrolase family 32 N-terminal domain-containing protein n=1 Tax=Celeribacter arenosi TaxID=792649 RepID=A0ABP7JUY7_9RHOB
MVLALKDQFIWDSWYVHDGEKYHGYYLKAPRSIGDPEQRHFNVSYGHATSTDLVNWDHIGECFRPSKDGWDNYTTWTGSVVRGDDDLWHLYYTGTRKNDPQLAQKIGHATSTDLHNWERVGDGLILDLIGPNSEHYECDVSNKEWHDRAMRDPWVMRDPEGLGWIMYFTARAPGIEEANDAGCIGFATSPDGYDWTLQPPVFTGGFGQLEVPQVFEKNGTWYCLFCTAAHHYSQEQTKLRPVVTGNHYLIGEGPRGPWQIAPGFLDGTLPCTRYAARIVDTDDGMVILGFADRPEGADFIGHIMDPDPVELTDEGLLVIPPQLKAAE